MCILQHLPLYIPTTHRAMKLMDVDVEEAHATLLLRMCYAGQRPASPAGEAPEAYRTQQGRRLLQVSRVTLGRHVEQIVAGLLWLGL